MSVISKIKVVILYAEVVGYVVGMLKELLKSRDLIEIDVVYWDKKNINSSQFNLEDSKLINFYARSTLTDNDIFSILMSRNPDIVFVSGWIDSGYLKSIRKFRSRSNKCKVVCGTDGQWKGTFKQHLGWFYFRIFYSNLFDFMWVAGKPQYHYAQRFGFNHEQIITNLYSADNEFFNKKAIFSKRFVFIGRFDPIKALDQLLDAYLMLPENIQCLWPLVLIGDGQMREIIENKKSKNIIIKPFMQPSELANELKNGGVSCVTSHFEQWGVAIHEMAILGYPLILSSSCGAATEFLISGYNGFLFKSSNTKSLYNALLKIVSLSDKELELFSQRSHDLSKRINSELCANSLISVLYLSEIKK